MITFLKPRYVIGIGNFARDRVQATLEGMGLVVGRITHPSPANPKANRGWEKRRGARARRCRGKD